MFGIYGFAKARRTAMWPRDSSPRTARIFHEEVLDGVREGWMGANTGQFGQWHSPFYYPCPDTQVHGACLIAHSNDTHTRARARARTNRINTWTRVIPTSFRGILHAPTNARARCLQTHTCSSRHTTSETRRFPLGIRVRTS